MIVWYLLTENNMHGLIPDGKTNVNYLFLLRDLIVIWRDNLNGIT